MLHSYTQLNLKIDNGDDTHANNSACATRSIMSILLLAQTVSVTDFQPKKLD